MGPQRMAKIHCEFDDACLTDYTLEDAAYHHVSYQHRRNAPRLLEASG